MIVWFSKKCEPRPVSKLRSIDISEVILVNRGANQDAMIALVKSASADDDFVQLAKRVNAGTRRTPSTRRVVRGNAQGRRG
jgi:hypothetical protein